MKKTLSLLLALVMVIGLFPVFADEAKVLTAEEAGAVLKGYGAIKGGSDGDLMIEQELKRQDAVIILTRLMGKEADAMATQSEPSFNDITIDYYKPFLAFAEAQKWIEGKGDKKFGFNDVVTTKEFAAMLLRALGHDTMGENYAKVMDLAKELKLFNGVMAEENANVIRGTAFILMNNTLETVPKGQSKKLRMILGYKSGDALEVASIKADSAKTIAVEFNREVVEEEAKQLTFKVLRGKTDINVKLEWNKDNTIATLTNNNTFAVGDYTVTVMKGEEEFAKKDIKFEQQKIAKIEIMSESVAVNPQSGKGYVVFRVYDQYEKDITDHFLGNGVTVNVGIDAAAATIKTKNGVIMIEPAAGKALLSYPQIPVTVYDRTSGISVTKTLPTAAKVGAISEFKFTPEKDVVIVNGDLATTVVIPYEAIDQAGQKTMDYNLIKEGLILGPNNEILTSINSVKVMVQQDPKDANKAQIVARFSGNAVSVNTDLNVIVTALLWNGKNTNMNIILKQANEVHTFRLSNPAQVVAAGDKYVDIPFEALDREGNKITKLAHLKNKVTLNGADWAENAQGDAVVRVINGKNATFEPNSIIFVTSTVQKTANFSQVSITVQKKHEADALYVSDAGKTIALEYGATKGYSISKTGHIYVQDQYGRYRELETGEKLVVKSLDTSILKVNDTDMVEFTKHGMGVKIKAVSTANEEKTAMVEYKVMKGATEVAKKTVSYVSVPSKNITSYNFYPVTKAYVNANSLSAPKARDLAYAVGYSVKGNTVSGIRDVILNEANYTKNLTVANAQEFAVKDDKVIGIKPLNNKAESTTKVTATINHNGNTDKHTYDLTGTTVLPDALDVACNGDVDDDGYLTFTESQFRAFNNQWLQRYQPKSVGEPDADTLATPLAGFSFDADDSYDEGWYKGRLELSFSLAKDKGNGEATVSKVGQLTTDKAKAGDEYRLIAAAANGVSQTVKIKVVPGSDFYEGDTTTALKVVGVETLPITDPAADLKVEVKFNRSVMKESVTQTAATTYFEFNGGAVSSAIKEGDETVAIVTIPKASVGAHELKIKKGIKVKENIDALKLANDYLFTLDMADYTWTQTSVATNPVPMVTGVSVKPLVGKVEVELTFNTNLAAGVLLADIRLEGPVNANADAAPTITDNKLKAVFTPGANWPVDKFRLLTLKKDNVKNLNSPVDLMEHNYSVLLKLDGTFEDAVKITNIETIKKAADDNQVKVTFNKQVKADNAWTVTNLTDNFDLNGNDAASATLAADGMSLVLTYADANFNDGNLVIKGLKDMNDNAYPDFTWVLANSAETMDKHVWTNQD